MRFRDQSPVPEAEKRIHEPNSNRQEVLRSAKSDIMNIYQINCGRCTWKSNRSTDSNVMPGLVLEYDCHMKYEHGGSQPSTEVEDEGHSEREEFRIATTPKTIPEQKDDRNFLLSMGRFLPGGINWKSTAKSCPLVQAPVLTRIDLSPIGLQALNQKTVKNCHDRFVLLNYNRY